MQRLQDVVAMMAERDLRRAQFARHAIQDAAAQPRAQRAGGLALGHEALDDAVRILILDVKRNIELRQIFRQHVLRKARLLLVEVHGHDLEVDRRALTQAQQHVEQRVAVLAARQAHHHLVALLDHVVVADRLADLAREPLEELVVLVGFLLLAARERGALGRLRFRLRVVQHFGLSGRVHARSSLMRKTSTPTASQSG
jgi:hypothetical protein